MKRKEGSSVLRDSRGMVVEEFCGKCPSIGTVSWVAAWTDAVQKVYSEIAEKQLATTPTRIVKAEPPGRR